MFAAIDEWKKLMAPYRKGSVKYKYDAAFQHLDYRIFLPDYQITFESSQWFMSDDVVAFLTEIADMLAGWGLKLKKADSTAALPSAQLQRRTPGLVQSNTQFLEYLSTIPYQSFQMWVAGAGGF